MNYVLNKISTRTIEGIKSNWYTQLESVEDSAYLDSTIERMVDWCEKVIEDNQTILWEVYDTENKLPRAIIELVDAKDSKDPSFKFLNIYLEPNLILDYKVKIEKDDITESAGVLAFAMSASFDKAKESGTKKLKIFGRTTEMHGLFDMLILDAPKMKLNETLYRQGSWLVIES